ncbi:septum formation initiator family protein [Meiothermus cerbereus]|uniref:septum formation initiator family protein n=1 Tax=Meiothermus cerbereus TaxID=65552 RepID=UPI000488F030|nr:septum formation initiator family protein [Meiothermus cerbereus]
MERPIYRFLHLVFALGTLHLLVLITLELQRNVQIRNQISQAQLRLEQLELRNQKLSEELELAADPRYREGLVRQMGYVHKDELLLLKTLPASPPSN